MDLNLIKKLVKLVEHSEITGLEVQEGELKIKIGKENRTPNVITQPHMAVQASSAGSPLPVKTAGEEQTAAQEEQKENLHEIKSPIVGTFYRAPAPDADPYIQVGDTVSIGTVLCIVEAMKLMNEIESDLGGKIVKILVENGKPVEYNQPLFLIQPT